MASDKIPLATVRRLCTYRRFLEKVRQVGKERTSSMEIGEYTGNPAFKVRKDLNFLGEVGVVGRGYQVSELIDHIATNLGLDRARKCVLVGAGSLGTAVIRFFANLGESYEVVAGFDVDERKVGKSISGVEILPVSKLRETVKKKGVELGLITVPAANAQETADLMVKAGIKGLLNFAPVILDVPEGTVKRDMDFIFEIETLSYLVGK